MNWQDFVALALVAGAALYLLRGAIRTRAVGAPPCGSSCGGCAAGDSTAPKLVSLSPPPKR